MTHSTLFQPLPKALQASEGYGASTENPGIGFRIFNPFGAGGFSSIATDMGRPGMMLLNGGEVDGARILKPEDACADVDSAVPGEQGAAPLCMSFYQIWRNDLRWIGHEGDLISFHSLFFVELTQKLILFVSHNSAGGGARPRSEIINQFSNGYFPEALRQQTFLNLPCSELEQFEGTYVPTRRADSTKLRRQRRPETSTSF